MTYPGEWELDALLADGAAVHIRPIRSSDGGALVEFHAGLSPETIRRRYFNAHPHLSQREVDRFTIVDYVDRFALVAVVDDNLVGVARYERTGPGRAEVAFVVADDQQGRGVGSLLLEHLAGAARQRGITCFEADTQATNTAMLGVFRDAGFEATRSFGDGLVHLEFPIAETPRSLDAADERDRRAEVASMRRLLRPDTVAVIGASRQPATIGHELFRNLIRGGFAGTVYPVNPAARSVAGIRAYPSMAGLPEPADLAVVTVPAAAVEGVVEECGQAGVKSVVVVSAGFAELGEEGRARQAELLRTARRHGMRVVGPNCLGIANAAPEVSMNATFAPSPPRPGPVGLLTQSGAMGIAVLERAAELDLGLSSFVSVGNKADISTNDLLCYWEADPGTRLMAVYLESFGNPRKFARIARRVSRAKPIVAVKSGRTSAGRRAAQSHTAAAASPEVAAEALFRQAGVIRVPTMAEMFDVALVLAHQPVPGGGRVAIVGNSGGPGILAADACEEAELILADLSDTTRNALAALLPPEASLANPVDLLAAASPATYEQALDIVLADDAVDGTVVIFTPPLVTQAADVSQAVLNVAARHPGKTLVAALLTAGSSPSTLVGPASPGGAPGPRVPVFPFPEEAVSALGHVARYGRWLARPTGTVPALPHVDVGAARKLAAKALATSAEHDGWLAAGEIAGILAAVGVPVVATHIAADSSQAANAASALGFPVVLKAAAPGLVHKTDVGGVVLNLGSPEAVRQAFDEMAARLGPAMGGAVVQSMAPPGIETLIGVTQDRAFGPLVAFGLGGISTEVLGDVAFRILPLTDVDAAELVRSVRAWPLLQGHRGRPAADVAAVEDILLRVGMLAEGVPELAELDLNPVIVTEHGATVVDAKMRLQPATLGPGPLARAMRV
ncbi:MAG: GNAT family N-acetyltransferase [Acidimicrobiaceae bacterium]|nr:GNAT family N-acetyltransferase [Acidimicrobiaceae bacterium]